MRCKLYPIVICLSGLYVFAVCGCNPPASESPSPAGAVEDHHHDEHHHDEHQADEHQDDEHHDDEHHDDEHHDDEHHDAHHDAGHPASYAEAVALVAKLQIQMKDALAAGDMKAADEPLHEIGHVLEEIPALAGNQSLSAPDKEKIKKAVHVLFDVYGEIDEEVHSEDTISYKPYAQKIESALGILQSFVPQQ